MALARFLEIPWANYSTEDPPITRVFRDGGPMERVAVKVETLSKRKFKWEMKYRPANADSNPSAGLSGRHTIDAFLVQARKFGYEPFLIHDPKDPQRVAINIGTGDGATTVFYLSTDPTVEYFRDYPFDDATTLAYKAGVLVATGNRTIDTDGRKVTFAVAPTMGQAVTLTYDFYRLVEMVGGISWANENALFASAGPDFEEILRDD